VTLIEGEVLDRIREVHGVHVHDGEHRRNIVTRGVALEELRGKRLRIGEVLLEYDGPRPPCSYVQRITEPGMTRALGEGAGICARVLEGGVLREGMEIEVIVPEGYREGRVLP
jgi:MOSC domain-containing protein YiiM